MRRHGPRSFAVVLLVLSSAGLSTPGFAQDADALRRELETLRRQFSTMTQAYEERLKALSDRVEQLEGSRAPAPPPMATAVPAGPVAPAPPAGPSAAPVPPARVGPATAPVAVAAVASAAPASEGPSVGEMLTPRQPFALSPPGRVLLFDIGVSGDFVADLTSAFVERRQQGTFPDRRTASFPARSSWRCSAASILTRARWCASARVRRRPPISRHLTI